MGASLIPMSLSGFEFYGLIILSFFTSFVTAAFGIGGGSILLAVMANIVPAKALIPVHGTIQFGSNIGRAALLLKQVDQSRLVWFTIGSSVGAVIGGNLVISLPSQIIQLALGCFIVYLVFRPSFKNSRLDKTQTILVGLSSTLLTMFVGATGPFVLAKIKGTILGSADLVATFSSMMVVQHGFKIAVFGYLGVAFHQYWGLILAMIITGFLGTFVGKKVLLKIPKSTFTRIMNAILLLLALKLIVSALMQFCS